MWSLGKISIARGQYPCVNGEPLSSRRHFGKRELVMDRDLKRVRTREACNGSRLGTFRDLIGLVMGPELKHFGTSKKRASPVFTDLALYTWLVHAP